MVALRKYDHSSNRSGTERCSTFDSEIKTTQVTGASPSYCLATIYAKMDEIDEAFEWLEKAYKDHEVGMYSLKEAPHFEPLHNDPRWQEMLDKVGFPE